MKSLNLITALFAILITANLTTAQSKQSASFAPMDGDLDPTFAGSGYVTTTPNNLYGARSIAVQADNKIVETGWINNGTNWVFGTTRYNTTGSIDTTFGVGGTVLTQIGLGDSYPSAVTVQPDGFIIVAGTTYNAPDYDFALVRYKSNGGLDTSFGTGGILITNTSPVYDGLSSIALQSDGKIVVTGFTHNETTGYVFLTIRYKPNGTQDNMFGSNGKVKTNIGNGTTLGSNEDYANSVAIQPDGKIVVAGTTRNGGTNRFFALVRYNFDGSPDTTFGSSAIVITSVTGAATEESMDVAIQPDGNIVAAGYSGGDFATVRYKPNGTLDSAFGSSGIVTTPNGIARSVVIQSSGKIVIAGMNSNGTNSDFAFVRYNSDGSLDNFFAANTPNVWGTGGIVSLDLGANEGFYDVKLDSYGRVVGGGYSFELPQNGGVHRVGLVRLYAPLAPTAANANLGGHVVTERGRGINNVKVTLTNQNGEVRYANTNQFGYFSFYDLPAGELYVVTVASKRYKFNQNSQTIQLDENFDGLNFVGSL